MRKNDGIDNWFDSFFWGDRSPADAVWRPRTDVVEESNAYVVTIDLPGLKKDDVSITVEENVLKIAGERKTEHEENSEGYRRLERSFGSFERTFRLPREIEVDKIESTYENGVLRVRVPKSEKALPRRIEVKVK
jgi:HSP20 family protein